MARAKTPRTTTSKQIVSTTQAVAAPRVPENGNSLSSAPVEIESKIRERAYELYQERGCTPGLENDDWFRAEREVLSRFNHLSA